MLTTPASIRASRQWPAAFLLAALVLPLAAFPFTFRHSRAAIAEMENRTPARLPAWGGWSGALGQETRNALSGMAADGFPGRPWLIGLRVWLQREVFHTARLGPVDCGRSGWLFYRDSLKGGFWDAGKTQQAAQAITHFLSAAEKSRRAARVWITIAPDKESIYPEYLGGFSRRMYEAALPGRTAFQRWCQAGGQPELIPVWRQFLDAKAQPRELPSTLYHPADTHHSHWGNVLFAKSLLDAIAPGMWDSSCIHVDALALHYSDLAGLAGLPDPWRGMRWLHCTRPGVVAVPRRECVWQGIAAHRHHSNSSGPTLVNGRTLFVHDSFGEPTLWVLGKYFADITTVHLNYITPAAFARGMREFDRVVVEVVERNAVRTLPWLLAESERDLLGNLPQPHRP